MKMEVEGAFIPSKKEVGRALSQILLLKDIKPQDVADAMGTHRNNLYGNLKGHRWITFQRFFELSHAIGCDPEDVLRAIRQVHLGLSVTLPAQPVDRAAEAFEDAKRKLLEARSHMRKDGDRNRGDS